MLKFLNVNKKLYLTLFFLCYLFNNNAAAHGKIEIDIPKIDVTRYPSIDDDLAALVNYSAYARVAGQHLVERGVEILTQAHGVLADPDSSFVQRIQLITVLGEIADESSASVIIEAAEQNTNNRYLYQNALLALSNFAQTEEIQKFVNRQLETQERDPLIQRTALAYYAKQPTEDANHWVDIYTSSSASNDVRYAALYLGGVLGRDDIKSGVIELLQTKQGLSREYYLLLGFANVATMEEFDALVKDKGLNKDNVKKVREFLTFRLANTEEKKKLSPGLLNSKNMQLKQAVVKHLIDEKDADVLATSWQQGDGVVRAAVKRAGFTINKGENGASMDEVHKDHALSQWQMLLVLVVLCAIVFFGWFVGSRNKR